MALRDHGHHVVKLSNIQNSFYVRRAFSFQFVVFRFVPRRPIIITWKERSEHLTKLCSFFSFLLVIYNCILTVFPTPIKILAYCF